MGAPYQLAPYARETWDLFEHKSNPDFGTPGQRELPIELPEDLDTRIFSHPNDPYFHGGRDHGALVWEEINGPTENRINVAVVSEGYTNVDDFMADFQRVIVDGLFGKVEPYKSYRDRFNIIAFHTDSPNEGLSSQDDTEHWSNYDMASDTYSREDELQVETEGTGIFEPLQFIDRIDIRIVMINQTEWLAWSGFAGGNSISVLVGDAEYEGMIDDSVAAISHELGHILGQLEEEYETFPFGFKIPNPEESEYEIDELLSYYNGQYLEKPLIDLGPGSYSSAPNLFAGGVVRDDLSNIPWSHWIDTEKTSEFGPLPWDAMLTTWNSEIIQTHIDRREVAGIQERLEDGKVSASLRLTDSSALPRLREGEGWSMTYDEQSMLEVFPIAAYSGTARLPALYHLYKPTVTGAMNNQPVAWYGPVAREAIMTHSLLNWIFPLENITSAETPIHISDGQSLALTADIVTPESQVIVWKIEGVEIPGEIVEETREVSLGMQKAYSVAKLELSYAEILELGLSDKAFTITIESYDATSFVRYDPAELRKYEHSWIASVGDATLSYPKGAKEFAHVRPAIANLKSTTLFDSESLDQYLESISWMKFKNREIALAMGHSHAGRFSLNPDSLPYSEDCPAKPESDPWGTTKSFPGFKPYLDIRTDDVYEIDHFFGGFQRESIPAIAWATSGDMANALDYSYWNGKPRGSLTKKERFALQRGKTIQKASYIALSASGAINGWLPESTLPFENWASFHLPNKLLLSLPDYGKASDSDGDGLTLEAEWTLKTDPNIPNKGFLQTLARNEGAFELTIKDQRWNSSFMLQRSSDLKQWQDMDATPEITIPGQFLDPESEIIRVGSSEVKFNFEFEPEGFFYRVAVE